MTGVALWFRYDWGPGYWADSGNAYEVYEDEALRLTTGDSRAYPFEVPGELYFPFRALTGSISYEAAPCYANCDNSTFSPVLNVGDFLCFMTKFAEGDSYANCDGSTTDPTLNVADFLCFLQSFAAGCS